MENIYEKLSLKIQQTRLILKDQECVSKLSEMTNRHNTKLYEVLQRLQQINLNDSCAVCRFLDEIQNDPMMARGCLKIWVMSSLADDLFCTPVDEITRWFIKHDYRTLENRDPGSDSDHDSWVNSENDSSSDHSLPD
jgi:hypothetical protein